MQPTMAIRILVDVATKRKPHTRIELDQAVAIAEAGLAGQLKKKPAPKPKAD